MMCAYFKVKKSPQNLNDKNGRKVSLALLNKHNFIQN